MDDPDDVVLYLLPHRGEGFDGAAFATAMPKNQSRFLPAPRSDAVGPRDIPRRQERGGTELPVERGLLENTDCLVVRFSHGPKTRVGVVGRSTPTPTFQPPKARRSSTNYLQPWNISTINNLRSGIVTLSLRMSWLSKGESMASTSSLQTSASAKRRTL